MANKTGDILLLFSCLFLVIIYKSLYFNNIFLSANFNLAENIYDYLCNYDSKGYFLVYKKNLIYILYDSLFFNINDYLNYNVIFFTSTMVCFFLIIASICKSAQSGFHF